MAQPLRPPHRAAMLPALVRTNRSSLMSAGIRAQAPAEGRLAAAIATMSFNRRPMRRGADRSNAWNFCMTPLPSSCLQLSSAPLGIRNSRSQRDLLHAATVRRCRGRGENSKVCIATPLTARRLLQSRALAWVIFLIPKTPLPAGRHRPSGRGRRDRAQIRERLMIGLGARQAL